MNTLNPDSVTRRRIEVYLRTLKTSLQGMPADEVAEIVREIGGHITERMEASGAAGDAGLTQILRDLGDPHAIASQYETRALLVRARASTSPALIFRATLRWGMRSLAGVLMCFVGFTGYALTLGFLVCAVFKPIFPDQVGLWLGAHRFALGYFVSDRPSGPEVLGWALIPIFLALGTILFIVTTRTLRWALRHAFKQTHTSALAAV
jgi:uncharacterized membrane protein